MPIVKWTLRAYSEQGVCVREIALGQHTFEEFLVTYRKDLSDRLREAGVVDQLCDSCIEQIKERHELGFQLLKP